MAIPQRSLVVFAPQRTSEPPRPGVGHPVSPAGIASRRQQDLPSSWGTSMIRLPCSKPTPAGLLAPDHYSAAAWPLVIEWQRLPRKVFRRSIAWLSDSLSTLRSAGYPNTTQDSLPAAGQALPDGLSTRKIPMKGFRFASYISSSFPKLRLAQWHRPRCRSVSSQTASVAPRLPPKRGTHTNAGHIDPGNLGQQTTTKAIPLVGGQGREFAKKRAFLSPFVTSSP